MNEYMEVFIAEAKELLDEMNESLLKLDKSKDDPDLINSIFRNAHTIKGNSASMGFKRMEALTHSMEDILQDIREGKIEIDDKIMELLFVCHDFLEGGLSTIMQTGNEEEMNIDGIMNKLHAIIEEKHSKLKEETSSSADNSRNLADFVLNKQELRYLKMNLEEGSRAYLIKITLAADCIFKTVRVWMWFQEMDKYLKVIKSDPVEPSAGDIKDNSFILEGDVVKLVAASKEEPRQLLGRLRKLLDVENMHVEPLEFKDTDFIKNQIRLVMARTDEPTPNAERDGAGKLYGEAPGEGEDHLIEIGREFSDDFTREIHEQLQKVQANIQALSDQPQKGNTFYKLSRSFHTIKGLADFIDSGLIAKLSGAAELMVEYYRKGELTAGEEQIRLLSTAAEDMEKLCGEKAMADDSLTGDVEKLIKKMADVTAEETAADHAAGDTDAHAGGEKAAALFDRRTEEHSHAGQMEESAAKAQSFMPPKVGNAGNLIDSSFMRISTHRIDSLVDMLGELLILHSLLEQEASNRFDTNDPLLNNLMRMAKVIKGIQNLSMSLRMVSVKQAFQKAARVGRDTAAELGKKVNISVMGEETEVDRDIADKLLDPLMHLVRNSISHGIEEEGERQKRGKTEEGHLSIQAYSKRGSVYIEVADDGTGLSIENIRAKALEKKLIDPDRNYSTDEIIRLIFLPGFSTSEKVDSISGRGVGMNVVETEMKKVSGKIDIVNRPGQGCRFILKIPLNLAVMNGTIVDICGERYILPTLYIKQFIRPEDNQWVKVKNERKMIRVRDEIIRVVPVSSLLGTEEPLGDEDNRVVIIVEAEQKLIALPVRNIIGRQEIVAKPLGKEFGVIDFASGASILGDGKVSLILDVEAMFKADY